MSLACLRGPCTHERANLALARIVDIGVAMIPTHGAVRAARFMLGKGVPAAVLARVLQGSGRRRGV